VADGKKAAPGAQESMKFKEAVRIAKIAISGRRAADEMLKFDVSHKVALLDCY